MRYPQTLTIERPAVGGSTASATGRFVPGGTATVIYQGCADVQDTRTAIAFDAQGIPTAHADAQVFLDDECGMSGLKVGDTGTIAGEPFDGQDCTIVGIRLLDGVVFVNWVRPL